MTDSKNMSCSINKADYTGVTIIELEPDQRTPGYSEARKLADEAARKELGDFMLVSWYDQDRDLESPEHAGDCHEKGAVPGYIEYGLSCGSTLKLDIEKGRFVFLYTGIEI